jgi:hypothetical protein
VLRYLAAGTAVVFLGIVPGAFGQTDGTGRIVGTVSLRGGGPLPGATVTVTGPGFSQSAVAEGSEGRFNFANLPQGTYAVTTQLAGFKSQTQRDLIVGPGLTTIVSLGLAYECFEFLDAVDMATLWGVRGADTIVHLRILAVGARTEWSFGDRCMLANQHTATVLRVVKTSPAQNQLGDALRFVQRAGDPSYAPGEEYVALLKWEAAAETHRAIAGFYMFPVRDGRVIFRRTDVPALKDQMPVVDFVSALKATF